MEKRLTDFERYLEILSSELTVDSSCKESICQEVRQNLYDKYSELLIKGHGLDSGVRDTVSSFEDPKKLAVMFNKLYRRDNYTTFANRDKAMLVVLTATLIMALLT